MGRGGELAPKKLMQSEPQGRKEGKWGKEESGDGSGNTTGGVVGALAAQETRIRWKKKRRMGRTKGVCKRTLFLCNKRTRTPKKREATDNLAAEVKQSLQEACPRTLTGEKEAPKKGRYNTYGGHPGLLTRMKRGPRCFLPLAKRWGGEAREREGPTCP